MRSKYIVYENHRPSGCCPWLTALVTLKYKYVLNGPDLHRRRINIVFEDSLFQTDWYCQNMEEKILVDCQLQLIGITCSVRKQSHCSTP